MPVVVDVGQVVPHAEMGGVAHLLAPGGNYLAETAIPVVQVEVIVFKEIIAHIDVRIAIRIQVADAQAQTVSGLPLENTGFPADICKEAIVIPVKPVPGERIRDGPLASLAVVAVRVDGMVEQKQVEVPVQVIVKKGSLGG